jgi:hypothetical protein
VKTSANREELMTDEQRGEQHQREETISDLELPEGEAGTVKGGLKSDSNEVAVETLKAGASEVLMESVVKPPRP